MYGLEACILCAWMWASAAWRYYKANITCRTDESKMPRERHLAGRAVQIDHRNILITMRAVMKRFTAKTKCKANVSVRLNFILFLMSGDGPTHVAALKGGI
jgi:hypothetical protein